MVDSQTGDARSSVWLGEVLDEFFRDRMDSMHFCVPGVVESFNPSNRTANIKPAVSVKFGRIGERELEEPPVLADVPIVYAGGNGLRIIYPLAKGDQVLLVFADRSTDEWQDGKNNADVKSSRRHSASDAFAIPALIAPGVVGPTDQVPSSGIEIGDGVNDVLKVISETLSTLLSAKVFTAMGPQQFDSATLDQLGILKGQIDSIKGLA